MVSTFSLISFREISTSEKSDRKPTTPYLSLPHKLLLSSSMFWCVGVSHVCFSFCCCSCFVFYLSYFSVYMLLCVVHILMQSTLLSVKCARQFNKCFNSPFHVWEEEINVCPCRSRAAFSSELSLFEGDLHLQASMMGISFAVKIWLNYRHIII